MNRNFDFAIGFFGFTAGLIGVGYAVSCHKKMNDICKRINKSIDDISNGIEVDLSKAVIDAAVKEAVERESDVAVKQAVKEIIYDMECNIRKEVKNAVIAQSSDIKKSVSAEITKQVSNIDIDDMKEEVVEKAKQQVAEKLDKNLDGILEKFNGDLTNISKIYKSIADVMSK